MSRSEKPSMPERQEESNAVVTNPSSFERVEETFDYGRDMVCFSHLRWNFVFQRPQHLMSRCARERRVFFVEEPVYSENASPQLSLRIDESGVCVAVPMLPHGVDAKTAESLQRVCLDELFSKCGVHDCISWYYTPMARAFSSHVSYRGVVYDCMDELSLFQGAPPALKEHEQELLQAADVVFTGGVSLYEAKKHTHPNMHPMPSSIDVTHFRKARTLADEPADQASIPRPRLGFAGVIDERMDLNLLAGLSAAHPEWHIVMIGPVVKIDPAILPQAPNLHYLGQKAYQDLPAYMAGWDIGILPFARNDATRFISPTKTPEYLAAGKPVISTSIRDVVRSYGDPGLVRIADDPQEFAAAVRQTLDEQRSETVVQSWLQRVDAHLARTSWDRTWRSMMNLIEDAIGNRDSLLQMKAS